jgi:hypothetical protein
MFRQTCFWEIFRQTYVFGRFFVKHMLWGDFSSNICFGEIFRQTYVLGHFLVDVVLVLLSNIYFFGS